MINKPTSMFSPSSASAAFRKGSTSQAPPNMCSFNVRGNNYFRLNTHFKVRGDNELF